MMLCHTCAHLLRRDNRCPIIGRYVRCTECACSGESYRPSNQELSHMSLAMKTLTERLHRERGL